MLVMFQFVCIRMYLHTKTRDQVIARQSYFTDTYAYSGEKQISLSLSLYVGA